MIRRIFGTINKRIDVGYDSSTKTVFVHSSSNCINLSIDEMDCLISVLIYMMDAEFDYEVTAITLHHKLWEPKTPPAEIKL